MEQNAALAAVFIAIAVAALMYVFAYPYLSGDIKRQRRAQALAASTSKDRTPSGGRSSDPIKRRKAIAETLKEFESQKKEKKVTLDQRIAQAGLAWTRGTLFMISAGSALAASVLLLIINGDLLIAAVGAAASAFGIPFWILSFLRNRRISRFIVEFPGAIDIIVRGVRAGLPVSDCFRTIANEGAEPVCDEFRQIVEAQTLGLSVGEATERLVDRMPIPEAAFFSIVVNLTQKSGGALSESLANLSAVLRERKKMKGKIQAMASEAKTSSAIIGALPFVVGGAVYVLTPSYIMTLFTTDTGKTIVVCCLAWMAIGVLMMRRMINFEI